MRALHFESTWILLYSVTLYKISLIDTLLIVVDPSSIYILMLLCHNFFVYIIASLITIRIIKVYDLKSYEVNHTSLGADYLYNTETSQQLREFVQ